MAHVETYEENDVTIVRLKSHELVTEEQIQQPWPELVASIDLAKSTRKLWLDFELVNAVNSAFVGGIILLNKMADVRGIEMQLRNLSPNVLESLQILQVFKVIPVTSGAKPWTTRKRLTTRLWKWLHQRLAGCQLLLF